MSDTKMSAKERELWHTNQCRLCKYCEKLSTSDYMCGYLHPNRGRRNCSIRMCEKFEPRGRKMRSPDLKGYIDTKMQKQVNRRKPTDKEMSNSAELASLMKVYDVSGLFICNVLGISRNATSNLSHGKYAITDDQLQLCKEKMRNAHNYRTIIKGIMEEYHVTSCAIASSLGMSFAGFVSEMRNCSDDDFVNDVRDMARTLKESREIVEDLISKHKIPKVNINERCRLGHGGLSRMLKTGAYSLETHEKVILCITNILKERERKCQK